MPYFRGVEIFIVTSSDARRLPEYPHPDGSSVRLVTAGSGLGNPRTGSQASQQSSGSNSSDTDPTRQKKVNPRISVYIPSIPGDQFRLRYLISQSSLPSRYVFFKMYINRHHIVSWGIDSTSCLAGSVSRSLCEPGDRYGGRNGRNTAAIETRYFHFMHGLDKKSVAEDGGVIEIQVLRCRGRKRVAVELDPYTQRRQERYGVTVPSGGLLENPQDATFYEYHLEDSRDSPYATFCFHYRSMKHLEQLNIIPQPEIRLWPRSIDPNGMAAASDSPKGSAGALLPMPQHQFTFGIKHTNTGVSNNDVKDISSTGAEPSAANSTEEYFLRSPPPLSLRNAEGQDFLQKSKVVAEPLRRPLPELPKTRQRAASGASLWSACPSLTPSLKKYVEGEDFENEEIQLGTARPAVFIASESMQALDTSGMNTRDHDYNSCSDYEVSSSSTGASQSPALPSPGGYVPTTGSLLEHDLDQWDSPIAQSSPKSKAKHPASNVEGDGFDNTSLGADALNVTESEWLRQSPSPRERRGSLFTRLWSPHAETRSSRSSLVELLGRNSGSPRNVGHSKEKESKEDSHIRNGGGTGYAVEPPKGNWI
ncbi:hypothetical protein GGR52DRAFT_592085 [Hypoxylon sp. FL1284]|nr:hypothetical protein GGR52DRAFT_592085 [Hypoxylon sp. FL1284]